MQKAFINQGIAALPEILNDLRIKKVFLVVGNNAYQSIENLIKPYTNSISIETFVMTDSNFKTTESKSSTDVSSGLISYDSFEFK